jgi:hypothetical protein
MKEFLSVTFDARQCHHELLALRALLDQQAELEEQRDLKPFFASHPQLAAFLGSYSADLTRFDLLAYEYQLFGDFACDLVVGDSKRQAYGFIELEEATSTSIYHRQGKKATLEWANGFTHGFHQIIDWFWKLDDMANTDDFAARFGRRRVPYFGLLVIGRSSALASPREQQRWEWHRRKVVVNSMPILHVTYDELCDYLLACLVDKYPQEPANG